MDTTTIGLQKEFLLLEQALIAAKNQDGFPLWYLEKIEKEVEGIKKENYANKACIVSLCRNGRRAYTESNWDIEDEDPLISCLERISDLVSPIDPKILERMHTQGQEALRKYNEFLAKEAAEKSDHP